MPVALAMEAAFERIDAALDRIAPEEFVEWVQGEAYQGHWRLFGVFHRDP